MKDTWNDSIARLPDSVRTSLSDSIEKRFRENEYYSTLEEVVRKRRRLMPSAEDHAVVPKVDPSDGDGADSEVCSKRVLLLQCMSQEDCATLDQGVRDLWTKETNGAGTTLSDLLSSDPPQAFWEDKYYILAFELFGAKFAVSAQSSVSGGGLVSLPLARPIACKQIWV